MARMRIAPGNEYDIVSPSEMHNALDQHKRSILDHLVREEIRGVKQFKFKGKLTDNLAGIVTGSVEGPQPGFTWMVRRFVTWEPTTTPGSIANGALCTSADNTFRNDNVVMVGTLPSEWAFSKGVVTVNAGDNLVLQFTGTNSGKTFYLSGEATEVPAEMLAKLLS